MVHTSYTRYTNKELLSLLENKRDNSPIIDELCSRLENIPEDIETTTDVLAYAECPVCEAKLKITEDKGNDIYSLTI